MDLYSEIEEKIKELNNAIESLKTTGNKFAEAERDYKIILRQEALKLRIEKNMPVTLISQTIFGVLEVANKRYERDVAEAMYETNKEYIMSLKLQIKVMEGQLNREWGIK